MKFIDGHKSRFGIEPICRVLTEHGCKIALEERVRLKDAALPATQTVFPFG